MRISKDYIRMCEAHIRMCKAHIRAEVREEALRGVDGRPIRPQETVYLASECS